MFLVTLYDQDCCLVISITEALIKECYSLDWGISSIKIGSWGWLKSSSCWLNPNLFQLWKGQKTSASLRPRSIEQFLIQISAFFFSYKHESAITTKTKRTICERRDPIIHFMWTKWRFSRIFNSSTSSWIHFQFAEQ